MEIAASLLSTLPPPWRPRAHWPSVTLPGIIARAWRTITTTTRTITAHHGQRHDRAFAIGTALNIGFVAAEIAFGLAANSMALLADAAHNFGDVLGLLLGWGATWLTRLPPTRRRTYGWGRSSILAALLNATILLIGVGAIGVEAVQRLLSPMPVMEGTVILVAAAGIVVNGATALLFLRGRGDDINLRAQFLHMAADAGVSAAVVVAGLLIMLTGWLWLDPLASLGVGIVIVLTTWGLLRKSIDLSMDAVPGGVAHDAGAGLPGLGARRAGGARSAHLGPQHDADRADRAPGVRRCVRREPPARRDGGVARSLRYRPCDATDRNRCRSRVVPAAAA